MAIPHSLFISPFCCWYFDCFLLGAFISSPCPGVKPRFLYLCPQEEPARLGRFMFARSMRHVPPRPSEPALATWPLQTLGLVQVHVPSALAVGGWGAVCSQVACGRQFGPSRPGEFRVVSDHLPSLQPRESPPATTNLSQGAALNRQQSVSHWTGRQWGPLGAYQ